MTTRILVCGALLLSLSLAGGPAQTAALFFGVLWLAPRLFLRNPERRVFLCAALLGASAPLLPMAGPGALLSAALLYLALLPLSIRLRALEWIAPLALITALWTAAFVILDFDAATWRAVWSGADGPGPSGAPAVLRYLSAFPPHYLVTVQGFSRMLVIALLFDHFRRDACACRGFLRGLIAGLFPAMILCAYQICGSGSGIFPNQNGYWRDLGRFPGTFSDPNAFGVFVALMLPLLAAWCQGAAAKGASATWLFPWIWLGLGFFSGSRTLFAGLLLYLLFFLYNRRKWYLPAGVGLACLVLAALNYDREFLGGFLEQYGSLLPVGIERFLNSLSFAHLHQAFFSRIVFAKTAWAMWLDHPLLGIGFDQFRELFFSYAKTAGVNLGTWNDNSNNFYLGVLAETGLLGFSALLWSVSRLKRAKVQGCDLQDLRCCRLSLWALRCLGILLLLGPHIEFDEIAVLAGFLMGRSVEPKDAAFPRWLWPLMAALVAPFLFLAASQSETGLYSWERGPQGYFRWSARSARISLQCDAGAQVREVHFQALAPAISASPVVMTLAQKPDRQVLTLSDNKLHSLTVLCGKATLIPSRGREANFAIELSRVWTPSKNKILGDQRLLGVQVIGE